MSKKLVIGVIGGGSIFSPELVQILEENADVFSNAEIRFMDSDEKRQSIVGGLCERILEKKNSTIEIKYVPDYEGAIKGADMILVQFRVGGEDARINDELLGVKYKIPFVETVTVCGFATFLRSYYEIEKIAALINEYAPEAWVLNFANPAGLLSEALSRLGVKNVVGCCNAPTTFLSYIKKKLGFDDTKDVYINWRGLNHLTFTDKILVDGKNILEEFIDGLEDYDSERVPFPVELIKSLGYLPNQYLQYYYLKEEIVEKLQKKTVRSQVVKEVNAALLEQYKDIDYVPEALMKRGGYGYSKSVVCLMRSLLTNDRHIHYIVIKNNGTLPDISNDCFVEVPAIAVEGQIYPLKVEPIPATSATLVYTMKMYETQLVEAAKARSKSMLFNALLMHPLIGSYNLAKPLLEDVLAENKDYLPELTK